MNFHDLLKQAKLPERTVPVCLRGDLVAEHEAVSRELEVAQKRKANSLEGTGAGHLTDRLLELEDVMRSSVQEFRLRALPRAAWRDMVNAYPPREKDGEVIFPDRLSGVNQDAMAEPLVKASIVDPDLSTEDWDGLMAVLTERQFDELLSAAWLLNQGSVDIPFSSAA